MSASERKPDLAAWPAYCLLIATSRHPGNAASIRVLQMVGMRYQREIMFDGYTHPDHFYVIP